MYQKIDHYSSEPLYHQLKEILRKNILAGIWQAGQKIPTEKELSRIFGVSNAVVRQAVSLLVEEGFLIKRQGKGTFVVDSRIRQGPKKLTSFTEELITKGFKPGSTIIEKGIKEADEKIANALNLELKTRVIMVKRLRLINSEPMGIQTFFCPEYLVPDFLENDLTRSLYELLETKYKLKIFAADEKYYATILDKHECKLLKVKWPFAGFIVERVAYDSAGNPIEYTESIIRSDKYSVQIHLRK
ncbi:MAG TPA: GntR family transcriptional regulator [Thermotogaceae bacterium]|nr:GntR family transcriptional regulator [Thermotogota bacterium]HEW91777.1 GntR family transcriptional regulator [Thermotogaceae bacterium]